MSERGPAWLNDHESGTDQSVPITGNKISEIDKRSMYFYWLLKVITLGKLYYNSN